MRSGVDMRVAQDATFFIFCRRVRVPLIDLGTIRLPRLIGHSQCDGFDPDRTAWTEVMILRARPSRLQFLLYAALGPALAVET